MLAYTGATVRAKRADSRLALVYRARPRRSRSVSLAYNSVEWPQLKQLLGTPYCLPLLTLQLFAQYHACQCSGYGEGGPRRYFTRRATTVGHLLCVGYVLRVADPSNLSSTYRRSRAVEEPMSRNIAYTHSSGCLCHGQ